MDGIVIVVSMIVVKMMSNYMYCINTIHRFVLAKISMKILWLP